MKNNQVSNQITVAVTLNLSSLVVALNFFDPVNWPKQIFLLTCLPLLTLLVFSSARVPDLIKFLKFPATKVLLCSVVLMVILVISSDSNITRTLWGSWGRNNGALTTMSLVFLWFLMHVFSLQNENLWTLLRYLVVLFSISAGYGFIQALGIDPIAWSTTGQVFGLYGNANFASAAWGIGTVLAFGLFVFDKVSSQKWFYVLAILALSGATLLTRSLQGILIIFIGVFLIIFSVFYKKSRLVGGSLIVGFLSCSTLLGAGFFGLGPLGTLLSQDTLILRKFYWLAGIEMAKTRPLLGVGIDGYGDSFREFRQFEVASKTGIDLITNNAHGSFIQTLATMGVVGLVAVALPVFLSLYYAVTIILDRQTQRQDLTLISILSLLLWVVANFSIDNISIALWNWSFLGLIVSERERSLFKDIKPIKDKSNFKFSFPWDRYLAYSLSIMMFIFSWTASSPDRTLLRDYKVNLKGNDLFLVEETKKSLLGVADQPFAMEAHFRYAAIALINASLNEEAILLLKKGHAIYSKDYGILDGLASTLEKSGRQEEAIPYREKQVKLEARSPLVWMNLALDYNSVGRTMDARSALIEALKFQRFVPSELTDQFTKAQNVILP